MKTVFSVTFMITIISLSILFANGGNVIGDGFKSSGNIILIQAKNISLVKENLYIKFKPNVVEVNVIYELENRDNDQVVKYGFPFKINGSVEYNINKSQNENSEWIPVYNISLNNVKIPYSIKFDKSGVESSKGYKEIIRWHLSDLYLKKGINIIEVNYTVIPYDEGFLSPRPIFEYDFKPAATWDNGIVQEIIITLDRSNINEPGMEVYYYGLINNSDRKSDKIIIVKKDVDLSKIENIEVHYDFSEYRFNRDFSFINNISKKSIKKITTSSNLSSKYTKKNLADGDFNTSWVEGKTNDGVGEWIEIEFDKKMGLPCFITIANGYYQNEELYYANNRIKSMKVTTFNYWLIESEDDNKESRVIKFEKVINLPDLPYVKPDSGNASKYLSTVFRHQPDGDHDGFSGVKKIRFEILSVYPGKKFNDTCISELLSFKKY